MNDPIERLLQGDARAGIPDNGFTARVMGALPARAVRSRPWLKPVLVMGSAALGSLLAVLLSPQGAGLLQGFADVMQLRAFTPAAVAVLAMCGALLVSALVLAAEPD